MSVQAKCLIDAEYASNTDTDMYVAAGTTYAIIDKFTATNVTAGSIDLSVNVVPSGGAVDDENLIIQEMAVAAGATTDIDELKNHVLNPGDKISVLASAASSIVVRASGREVTP